MIDRNPSVNRELKDKAMNRIDHALGRPVNPMEESYRNYFYTYKGDEYHSELEDDPNWFKASIGEDWAVYRVTNAGREALQKYLRAIGSKTRLFVVSFNGFEESQVAKTHSEARYLKWLSVSDCYDITFGEFMKRCRVRVAA